MVECLVCGKPAEWTRHTQFAGDHPYCEEHAKAQKDFGENDSYTFWSNVEENRKKLVELVKAGASVVDDFGGYEESTHEKQQEFAKNRNDPWDEWKPSKDL